MRVSGCLGSSIAQLASTLQALRVEEKITIVLDDLAEIQIIKVSILLRVVIYPPFFDQGLSTRIDPFSRPRHVLESPRQDLSIREERKRIRQELIERHSPKVRFFSASIEFTPPFGDLPLREFSLLARSKTCSG